MVELRLRKRHRLRQKEIKSLAESLDEALGTRTVSEGDTVDLAEAPDYQVVFVDGKILAVVLEGTPFLTIRGLLRYGATKRYVTVDMGAVRFIANGADVMGPGIVDADPGIVAGDLVWVRDVKNGRPLAVGRSLVACDGLMRKEKGKAITTIHYVGDRLWALDEAEPPEAD
jgi:PUA-domain protein